MKGMYHKKAYVLNSSPKEKESQNDAVSVENGPKMSFQIYPITFSKYEK